MKRSLLFVSVLVLSLVLSVMPTLAQEGSQSYTNFDGTLTLTFPDNWSNVEVEGLIYLVNQPELDENRVEELSPADGEMIAIVVPPSFLSQIEAEATAPAAELAPYLLNAFAEVEVEPETFEVDGKAAASVSLEDGGQELYVVSVELEAGTMSAIAISGGAEDFKDTLHGVLANAEVSELVIPSSSDLPAIDASNAASVGFVNQINLSNPNGYLFNYAISPNSNLLALAYEDFDTEVIGIDIVDLTNNNEVVASVETDADTIDIAFIDDGNVAVYTPIRDEQNITIGSTLSVFDIETGDLTQVAEYDLGGGFLYGNNSVYLFLYSNTNYQFIDNTGSVVGEGELAEAPAVFGMFDFAGVSADAEYVLYGLEPWVLGINTADGSTAEVISFEDTEFENFYVSPDGSLYAISTDTVVTFLTPDGESVASTEIDTFFVSDVVISPNNSVAIAIYDMDGGQAASVIDTATGDVLHTFETISNDISDVYFSPAGNFITLDGDFGIYMFAVTE